VVGLVSDSAFAGCNTRSWYGVYLWTAGIITRNSSHASYSWKLISSILAGSAPNIFVTIFNRMNYSNWYQGQPDNNGGNENCINIFSDQGYKWNDEACDQSYCFVCENRNINV